MIDYIQKLLNEKGGVVTATIVQNKNINVVSLIAVDAIGAVFVLESNLTVAMPWHQIDALRLGDVSA